MSSFAGMIRPKLARRGGVRAHWRAPHAPPKPTEERQTGTDALLESVQFSVAKNVQFSVAIDTGDSSGSSRQRFGGQRLFGPSVRIQRWKCKRRGA